MMNDAYQDILRLNSLWNKRRIAKKEYTHAASVLFISYISQLEMLPNRFWESLDLYEQAYLDTLRICRNNFAHNYNIRTPDFDFIRMTVLNDLPQVHSKVMNFYSSNNLANHPYRYITKSDFRHKRKSRDELLSSGVEYPKKAKEKVIYENRKPNDTSHRFGIDELGRKYPDKTWR